MIAWRDVIARRGVRRLARPRGRSLGFASRILWWMTIAVVPAPPACGQVRHIVPVSVFGVVIPILLLVIIYASIHETGLVDTLVRLELILVVGLTGVPGWIVIRGLVDGYAKEVWLAIGPHRATGREMRTSP